MAANAGGEEDLFLLDYVEEDDPSYVPQEEEEDDDDGDTDDESPEDVEEAFIDDLVNEEAAMGDDLFTEVELLEATVEPFTEAQDLAMPVQPFVGVPPVPFMVDHAGSLGRQVEESVKVGEEGEDSSWSQNRLGEVGLENSSEVGSSGKKRVETEDAIWEYEADCSVCMEPWTEDDHHQSCSLACGHTFGRLCIEKWIRQCKKNTCPKCKKRCKVADIRPIYPKRVAVVEKVLQKELNFLQGENKQLKKEIEDKTLMLEEICQELKEIRRQKEKLVKEARERQMASCCQTVPREEPRKRLFGVYNEGKGFETDFAFGSTRFNRRACPCRFVLKQEFRVDGARVFDMDASSEIMLLSRRLSGVNGGCVLSKINLLYPTENESIPLPPNHKAIRDLCISQRPDKLALLASLGKKLSIVSWLSNNVVLTYDLPSPAWSCAWDVNDVHHVYAGLQNGMLVMFDLRQTATHMSLMSGLTGHPVHTLHSLGNNGSDGEPCSSRTLLSASASGPCLWNASDTDNESVSYLIPGMENQGVCISLAYCASSDDIVATYRQKVQTSSDLYCSQPGVSPSPFPGSAILGSHVYIKRVDGNIFNSHDPRLLYVSEVRMPKSAIISFQNSSSIFAYGDEGTRGVLIRELPSLDYIKDLRPHEHCILDVKYSTSDNFSLLGCISENRAQVFSVCS